MKAADYCVFHP